MQNITVKNLNFYYGKNQALFDINVEFQAGDIIVLLGKSGAGKSTFIKNLNLLEIPQSGQMNICGQSFNFEKKISEKEQIQLRRKVGMIFQNYNLWPHKTVLKNLTYVPVTLKQLSKAEAEKKALELLEQLHITELKDKFPLQLSGGQQQRVAICRTLMTQPEVLLYDEPTAALDPSMTATVAQIITDLKRTNNITQVVVTHDVGFAQSIADYIYYFDNGRIAEEGKTQDIFFSPKSPELRSYLNSFNQATGDSMFPGTID